MRHAILTALFASSAVAAAVAAPEAPTVGREVGQVFPQVVLPSLDGRRPVALSQFRGKKLLLIEYAAW
jgi:hypothetical protein